MRTVPAVAPLHSRPIGALVGRAIAAAGLALGIGGVALLGSIGRWDLLPLGSALFAVFSIGFGSLAWLALRRQPQNRALWVPAGSSFLVGMSASAFAVAVWAAAGAGLDVTPSKWAVLSPSEVPALTVIGMQLVNLGPVVGFFSMLTFWLLLFPAGRLPSPAWRWLVGATVAAMGALLYVLVWIARAESTIPFGALPSTYPPGIPSLTEPLYFVLILLSGACVISLILRYRRSDGDLRQQYRGVLLGSIALYVGLIVVDQEMWQLLTALLALSVSVAAYGVAVTKYRLLDIDLVISRTFVYGTLAVFIGSVYVVVVMMVGGMLGGQADDLVLSVVATAMVALAFEPIRRRAQRWANRLVYGKRATPYEVLATIARRLAVAEPGSGILERMAQLMAEGTGARKATVWLSQGTGLVAAAGWPDVADPDRVDSLDQLSGASAPVFHEDELVGVLEVVKQRGQAVTPPEQRLITDLAGSAGLLLGHERLNTALASRAAELRASRRRLVELGDAERRQLERDLHDGAQQQVVAIKMKIALAEHMAHRAGDEGLARYLHQLTTEVQETLEEIRRVARGIFPQLRESGDVVTAVRSQAASCRVPVRVSASTAGPYPQDVEAAIYFSAVEAMTNAVAYASPNRVEIDISDRGDEVTVEVRDDGTGFDFEATGEGPGLTNIRDRVEALGGDLTVESSPGAGTTVRVRIPLRAVEMTSVSPEVAEAGLSAPDDFAPQLRQDPGREVRLG